MSLNSSLRDLGLHKSEVAVYLFLLRNGASTVKKVSHGTKIARTNCYHVIRELLQKGLITKQILGNKIAFAASELSSMNEFINSKSLIVKSIMPELESAYFNGSLKPQVTFLSQIEEISMFFDGLCNIGDLIFYGPRPGDPEQIKVFYENIKNSSDKISRTFIHPRRIVNCYFILWEDKIAIIPISTSPHVTIIQNSDIRASITTMINT